MSQTHTWLESFGEHVSDYFALAAIQGCQQLIDFVLVFKIVRGRVLVPDSTAGAQWADCSLTVVAFFHQRSIKSLWQIPCVDTVSSVPAEFLPSYKSL